MGRLPKMDAIYDARRTFFMLWQRLAVDIQGDEREENEPFRIHHSMLACQLIALGLAPVNFTLPELLTDLWEPSSANA